MSFKIGVPHKYDLFASVHAWIYPDVQPVPEITLPPIFYRLMTIDEGLVPVIIRQPALGQPLTISFAMDTTTRDSVGVKIRRTLSLATDISGALKSMGADPRIAPCAEFLKGIRPYLADTPFEALIKTIIQQQISFRAANVITNRLVAALSKPMKMGELLFYAFPSPEAFVRAGIEGLREFGLGYKAGYVYEVSRLFGSGFLSNDGFDRMSDEEIDAMLRPIKGIGNWTIRVFILSALGRNAFFPYDDLGIQNLMGALYNKGVRMTKQQVIDQAATWGSSGPLVLYLLMCGDVLGIECLK